MKEDYLRLNEDKCNADDNYINLHYKSALSCPLLAKKYNYMVYNNKVSDVTDNFVSQLT